MAGSLNSLRYDANTYAVDLRQSTAPLLYQLEPMYANHCHSCRPSDVGWLGRNGVSIKADQALIDTDSELRLLNYRNTRDPALQFHPSCSQPACRQINGYQCAGGITANIAKQQAATSCQGPRFNYSDCTKMATDYSRLDNPSCSLRETGINRFVPMCLNFQDINRWLHPGEVGINYRMVSKDNHAPRIPRPLDQRNSLPDPHAPAPETMPRIGAVGVFNQPMHEYYRNLLTTPYRGKDC